MFKNSSSISAAKMRIEGSYKISPMEKKYDLKDRLINYAVRIIELSKSLPSSKEGKHISGQVLSTLIR
jgi:hypothetical protein